MNGSFCGASPETVQTQRSSGFRPSCRNVHGAAFVTPGFLLQFTAIGTNVLTRLIPPPDQKKSIAIPPAQHLAVRRWTGLWMSACFRPEAA
jgi:hypothetical protein